MELNQIIKNLGIESLTQMQQECIESYPCYSNLVLLSPTGSGKTFAYTIPLTQSLDTNLDKVQAVVIVPSRELAQQSCDVFQHIKSPLRAICLHGGRPAMDEHRTMKGILPQVVFSTPGRLLDHLNKGNIESGSISTFIIDEFDKCLELGFHDEMREILDRLPNVNKKMLLSATDAEEIPSFVELTGSQEKHSKGIKRIDYISEVEDDTVRLSLNVVHSPEKDKLETLALLLSSLGQDSCIVFVNYREAVERVGGFLKSKGFVASIFHGGLEQRDRERSLFMFSNGSSNIFVSTDLASRGLDIPEIRHIIHYHLPANKESYTHRNGRTARWTASGNSYIILGPEETLPEFIDDLSEDFEPSQVIKVSRPKYATLYIGRGKKDKVNKMDVVGFLCKIGKLNSSEIGRIDVLPHNVFVAIDRSKLRQTLNLIRGEKIKGQKTIFEEAK